uniref:Uncharacterized protein n=1 Tax=Romanomermis culicivorax TaxID=13658 RepID=A0A915L299_ROMCU
IRLSQASSSSLTYCEQIPQELFEYQGVSTSHKALNNLLDDIIRDKFMSANEKRKRLKKTNITWTFQAENIKTSPLKFLKLGQSMTR